MPRHNTEERQRQIALAMKSVMAARGYEGASIAEIARAAGLAPGLIHYHFEDKRHILLALLDLLHADALRRVDSFVLEVEAPHARVGACIDAYLSLERDADPAAVACWVAMAAEAIRSPDVRASYDAAIRAQTHRVRALIADALPKASRRDAGRIAAALLAAIQGHFVLAATCPGVVAKGSAATMVRRMAEGLLRDAGGES